MENDLKVGNTGVGWRKEGGELRELRAQPLINITLHLLWWTAFWGLEYLNCFHAPHFFFLSTWILMSVFLRYRCQNATTIIKDSFAPVGIPFLNADIQVPLCMAYSVYPGHLLIPLLWVISYSMSFLLPSIFLSFLSFLLHLLNSSIHCLTDIYFDKQNTSLWEIYWWKTQTWFPPWWHELSCHLFSESI